MNIIPQPRFKLQTPLTIEQQIPSQPRPIFTEGFISGIVTHGFELVPDRGKEVVKVGFVLPIVELAT